MLFFADSGERALVQAVQIGSVVLVISASLALVAFLTRPFQPYVAGLSRPRWSAPSSCWTQGRAVVGDTAPPPCDDRGAPRRP